ncbi:hypothetical protein BDZ45DRAFT_807731 [Acephala macrosclerotiorum]|nr:hypothetical protein BDZ45DRAFT_807731 [Acephala macrosclerotiorum]
MRLSATLAALVASASSTILWDGRFNTLTSSEDLNTWSWSNQVGPYQYYIHGPSASYWNSQTMRRTELIPQTTAAINFGKVRYHFSIMHLATNPPSIYREHQICLFESHFTELKSGWISGESGTSDPLLRWDVSGTTHWSTGWDAGVWHNVAYEIVSEAQSPSGGTGWTGSGACVAGTACTFSNTYYSQCL